MQEFYSEGTLAGLARNLDQVQKILTYIADMTMLQTFATHGIDRNAKNIEQFKYFSDNNARKEGCKGS